MVRQFADLRRPGAPFEVFRRARAHPWPNRSPVLPPSVARTRAHTGPTARLYYSGVPSPWVSGRLALVRRASLARETDDCGTASPARGEGRAAGRPGGEWGPPETRPSRERPSRLAVRTARSGPER